MKRIIYLGTRFVVVAALFLGLVAFGCHGGSVSDSEDIGSGGDDGAVAGDQVTIGDQVVSDRSILLAFGAEVSPSASIAKADSIGMTQAQVEAGITIVDSGDVRVDGADLHTIWAADGMSARIHGPFRWCETYTVTIAGLGAEGGDVSTPVTMAKNPDDFDGIVEEDDFCTADLPILFDYLETVWVFRGSDVIDPSQLGYQISLASPPAIDGLWEYTVNSSGAGINNLGDTVGDGKCTFSVADEDNGVVLFWHGLDTTAPWASWNPATGAPGVNAAAGIGDFNGDGLADFGMPDLKVIDGDTYIDPVTGGVVVVLQYILGGSDLALYDYIWEAADVTFEPDFAFGKACGAGGFGNLDGDVSEAGYPLNDFVACLATPAQRILIGYGEEAVEEALPDNVYSIDNFSNFTITDVTVGDVNGDGAVDVAAALYGYGAESPYNNEVRIFFSEKGVRESKKIVDHDVTISAGDLESDDDMDQGLIVKSAGDINADGMADIVIATFVIDPIDNSKDGRAYVFLGRESWESDYTYDDADIKIEGDNQSAYEEVEKVGDLDNDGFDELAIMVKDYNGSEPDMLAIFNGSNSLTGATLGLSKVAGNNDDVRTMIIYSTP